MKLSTEQGSDAVVRDGNGRLLSLVSENSLDKERVDVHVDITEGLPGGSTKKKDMPWWAHLFGKGKSATADSDSIASYADVSSTDGQIVEEAIGTELDALGEDEDNKLGLNPAKGLKKSRDKIAMSPRSSMPTVSIEECRQNACSSPKVTSLMANWEIIPIVTLEEFMASSFTLQKKSE